MKVVLVFLLSAYIFRITYRQDVLCKPMRGVQKQDIDTESCSVKYSCKMEDMYGREKQES